MIIRPPRAKYQIENLGPDKFTLNDRICQRIDIDLKNARGLTLKCSHWTEYPPKKAPCVIYMHGNCGCRLDSFESVAVLLRDGITVFALDFSGSGLSEGEYISLGYFEREDVRTVVEYLRTVEYVTTIGLWGRSMGAATALMFTASDPSIAAVVLDSPFSSLSKLAVELVNSGNFPIQIPKVAVKMGMKAIRKSILHRAKFDIVELAPIKYVEACFTPALFTHGSQDSFILPHHCHDLYEKYAGDKNLIMVDGNHNTPRPPFFHTSVSIFFQNTLLDGDIIEKSPRQITVSESGTSEEEGIPTLDEEDFKQHAHYANEMTDLTDAQMEEKLIQQAILSAIDKDNTRNAYEIVMCDIDEDDNDDDDDDDDDDDIGETFADIINSNEPLNLHNNNHHHHNNNDNGDHDSASAIEITVTEPVPQQAELTSSQKRRLKREQKKQTKKERKSSSKRRNSICISPLSSVFSTSEKDSENSLTCSKKRSGKKRTSKKSRSENTIEKNDKEQGESSATQADDHESVEQVINRDVEQTERQQEPQHQPPKLARKKSKFSSSILFTKKSKKEKS